MPSTGPIVLAERPKIRSSAEQSSSNDIPEGSQDELESDSPESIRAPQMNKDQVESFYNYFEGETFPNKDCRELDLRDRPHDCKKFLIVWTNTSAQACMDALYARFNDEAGTTFYILDLMPAHFSGLFEIAIVDASVEEKIVAFLVEHEDTVMITDPLPQPQFDDIGRVEPHRFQRRTKPGRNRETTSGGRNAGEYKSLQETTPPGTIRASSRGESIETMKRQDWNLVMSSLGKRFMGREWPTNRQVLRDAGKGVDVYVLDSSINIRHKGFGPRATNWEGLSISPFTGQSAGDISGHGTHVAGIIGDTKIGVAPHVNLINVKVFRDDNDGIKPQTSDLSTAIILAMNRIIKKHIEHKSNRRPGWKGTIINASWSFADPKLLPVATLHNIERVFRRARAEGIITITTAGNTGTVSKALPCTQADSVICVGSVDKEHHWAKSSSSGPAVAIAAPGMNILSNSNTDNIGYIEKSGTSMASPAVAGAFAIWLGHEGPEVSVDTLVKRMRDNAISGAIDKSSLPVGTVNLLLNTGVGNPVRGTNPYVMT